MLLTNHKESKKMKPVSWTQASGVQPALLTLELPWPWKPLASAEGWPLSLAHETGTISKPCTESLALYTNVSTTKCHPTLSVSAVSAAQLLLLPFWKGSPTASATARCRLGGRSKMESKTNTQCSSP